jgi:hypothetical protein
MKKLTWAYNHFNNGQKKSILLLSKSLSYVQAFQPTVKAVINKNVQELAAFNPQY